MHNLYDLETRALKHPAEAFREVQQDALVREAREADRGRHTRSVTRRPARRVALLVRLATWLTAWI